MTANWARRLRLGLIALLIALVLLPLTALAVQEGTVSTSSLVLRASASKNASALQTLRRGATVYITGSSGEWYRVTYGKFKGYVLKTYVSVAGGRSSGKSSSSGSSGSSSQGKSGSVSKDEKLLKELKKIGKPSACAPGHTGANVKKLQRCLQAMGYYKGAIDGIYGTATRSAVMRLQSAKHLRSTGVASKQTIGAMFGQVLEEDYVTERLDWFDGNENTIPRGAVFTVKDCKSGKTFQCKRWAGGNHMDTMPLTKADTAVMKSIYGSWSWHRRPVLVLYNGHVYAGSMNGMPHGTTTISNNNFPGHFCIHFYGSMTHGTHQVDATHQSCVSMAMNYKW